MANIVQQTSKTNHTNRSTFDLSGNINLTTTTGMLLPIRVDDCLPNSRYSFNISTFARTIQMIVPSFARVRAHIDTFFVPYRLLGDEIQATIVGDQYGKISNYDLSNGAFDDKNLSLPWFDVFNITSSPSTGKIGWKFSSAPYSDSVDAAGISCEITTPILLNALGYGYPAFGTWQDPSNVTSRSFGSDGSLCSSVSSKFTSPRNARLSVLNLLAYQKIYQDFYRNKLWEMENRSSYYLSSSDMGQNVTARLFRRGTFEMRYHDYDKDRLIGMIPDEQGILSQGISDYASSLLNAQNGLDNASVLGLGVNPDALSVKLVNTSGDTTNVDLFSNDVNVSNIDSKNGNITYQAGSGVRNVLVQQYSAITQRRMEAFQKFAEICQLNKSDYKHQIKAHFGFTPNDYESDYCRLVSSMDIPLQISDVENTTTDNQGYLAGKGVFSGTGRSFSVDVSEHGCIMSILYIVPQIDWSNEFVDRSNTRLNRYDFAIPEFDRIGFEPVRICDWFGFGYTGEDPVNSPYDVIGYLPRYWYYKTRLDVNSTGFSSDSKSSLNFDSYVVRYKKERLISALDDGVFFEALKSLPSDLDGLFPSSWSDVQSNPFIFSIYIKCTASLPLSVDSLPY